MSRQTAMWTLAALLGIVLTAGITWATSQLTSQRIGISSEPISAAGRLAPRAIEVHAQPRRRKVVKRAGKVTVHTTTSASPVAPVTTMPTPPVPLPAGEPAPEAGLEPVKAGGGSESSADDSGGKGKSESSGHTRDD
jgi:hypothetical protein